MDELQNQIDELRKIVETTEDINNKKGSISQPKRETLRTDTTKLHEISEKIEELALKLGDERLQSIAEEIEELRKEREIYDNKKAISAKENLVDNKISGKSGYSDRSQIGAIDELLDELSDKLKNVKSSIQEKINEERSQSERLLNFKSKEDLLKEIIETAKQSSPLLRIAIMKELTDKGLIEKDANLSNMISINDLRQQDLEKWKSLNNERQSLEMLQNSEVLSFEERENVKKDLQNLRNRMTSYIHNESVYEDISRKINELEERTKEFSPEESEESLTSKLESQKDKIEKETGEARERIANRIKEKRINNEIQKVLDEKNPIIKRNMSLIPIDLRLKLSKKLDDEGLLSPVMRHDYLDESDYTVNEEIENIDDINKLDEIIENITSEIVKDRDEIQDYANRQSTLIIRESLGELSKEEKKYKEKVKKYIKELLDRINKNVAKKEMYLKTKNSYNEANKTIDELIESVKEIRGEKQKQENPTATETRSNSNNSIDNNENKDDKENNPENIWDTINQTLNGEEPTAIVPLEPAPVVPYQEPEKTPEPAPVPEPEPAPEEQEVTKVEKPKNKTRIISFLRRNVSKIVVGLMILGAAVGIFNHKKHQAPQPTRIETVGNNMETPETTEEGKPVIEIISTTPEDNLNDETEDLMYLEEDPETIEEVKETPLAETAEMRQQALRESGATKSSGENEQEVKNGTGKGISEENMSAFDHKLVFEPTKVEGVSHIVEIQPDGSEVKMKHITTSQMDDYIDSLARQRHMDPEDLYDELVRTYTIDSVMPEQLPEINLNNIQETEMPSTEYQVKPLTHDILQQAVIESDMIEKSGENELDVMRGIYTGIKPENLELYCENPLHFEYDYNSNTAHVFRKLKDGTMAKDATKTVPREVADAYLYSLHTLSNTPLEELYGELTDAPMETLTKGVSR